MLIPSITTVLTTGLLAGQVLAAPMAVDRHSDLVARNVSHNFMLGRHHDILHYQSKETHICRCREHCHGHHMGNSSDHCYHRLRGHVRTRPNKHMIPTATHTTQTTSAIYRGWDQEKWDSSPMGRTAHVGPPRRYRGLRPWPTPASHPTTPSDIPEAIATKHAHEFEHASGPITRVHIAARHDGGDDHTHTSSDHIATSTDHPSSTIHHVIVPTNHLDRLDAWFIRPFRLIGHGSHAHASGPYASISTPTSTVIPKTSSTASTVVNKTTTRCIQLSPPTPTPIPWEIVIPPSADDHDEPALEKRDGVPESSEQRYEREHPHKLRGHNHLPTKTVVPHGNNTRPHVKANHNATLANSTGVSSEHAPPRQTIHRFKSHITDQWWQNHMLRPPAAVEHGDVIDIGDEFVSGVPVPPVAAEHSGAIGTEDKHVDESVHSVRPRVGGSHRYYHGMDGTGPFPHLVEHGAATGTGNEQPRETAHHVTPHLSKLRWQNRLDDIGPHFIEVGAATGTGHERPRKTALVPREWNPSRWWVNYGFDHSDDHDKSTTTTLETRAEPFADHEMHPTHEDSGNSASSRVKHRVSLEPPAAVDHDAESATELHKRSHSPPGDRVYSAPPPCSSN